MKEAKLGCGGERSEEKIGKEKRRKRETAQHDHGEVTTKGVAEKVQWGRLCKGSHIAMRERQAGK